MDGDSPDLQKLINLAEEYGAEIIVDEAHGLGIIGNKGQGLVAHLNLQEKVLATIYPLGKAVGSSGAFVCGSELLKSYLVNFCRSFIFSTAPSKTIVKEVEKQLGLIKSKTDRSEILQLKSYFLLGISEKFEVITGPFGAIVSVMISGNSNAKKIEKEISEKGVFVKAILYPTIPKGQERLRICFHQYNSKEDVDLLLSILNRSN
jgi:8-amino-7-oxononanoate synthase